jgi:hypothetical protein
MERNEVAITLALSKIVCHDKQDSEGGSPPCAVRSKRAKSAEAISASYPSARAQPIFIRIAAVDRGLDSGTLGVACNRTLD